MKIKKYGYSNFNKTTELGFAILIPVYSKDKKQSFRFVTTIDYNDKTWIAENKKKAYLFGDRKSAQDFIIACAYNFTSAYVVEVLEGMELGNNW